MQCEFPRVALYVSLLIYFWKGKGKVHPCTGRTAHRGCRGLSLLFLDHGISKMWELASRPGRSLPPGKTQYPLYRRLGRPQGRSGQVWKISPPPVFDPRTFQPRSQSLYRLRYPTQLFLIGYGNQHVMVEVLWLDMTSVTNFKNPISSSNKKKLSPPANSRGKWSSNWVSKAMWGCYSWSPFRYATLPTEGSLKPGEDFWVRCIRRGEQWRHQIISDQSGIWMSILLIVFLWWAVKWWRILGVMWRLCGSVNLENRTIWIVVWAFRLLYCNCEHTVQVVMADNILYILEEILVLHGV